MALNKTFQSQSNAIASYDYQDIAEGTGTIIFYGFEQVDSTGTKYGLSENLFYSTTIEETYTIDASHNLSTAKIDHDFDLTAFNTPKTIAGTGRIQQGFALGGRDGEDCWAKIIYTLVHYDGTTETTIGTATTETYKKNGASTDTYVISIPITITRTSFKKGDTLRLTEKVYVSGAGLTNVGEVTIAYDPQNRDGAVRLLPSSDDVITRLEVHIPFNLDL